MAYSKMSLRNAISMTFLFMSFVTRITDMVGKQADFAIYIPAGVAHIGQFGSEILSRNPEWFREGMGIFAYSFLEWEWKEKDVLTWAVTKKSTHLGEEFVNEIFKAAFAKWEKVSKFTFEEVDADEEPDIRMEFGQPRREGFYTETVFDLTSDEKEIVTVTIQFIDADIYIGASKQGWANLSFVALYEIGQALGLNKSDDPTAVMYKENDTERMKSADDPKLSQDDKDGIKAKYKNATSAEKTQA